MIAEAVLATGLPPEVFGVPSSEKLGAVILEVLWGNRERSDHASNIAKYRAT